MGTIPHPRTPAFQVADPPPEGHAEDKQRGTDEQGGNQGLGVAPPLQPDRPNRRPEHAEEGHEEDAGRDAAHGGVGDIPRGLCYQAGTSLCVRHG